MKFEQFEYDLFMNYFKFLGNKGDSFIIQNMAPPIWFIQ